MSNRPEPTKLDPPRFALGKPMNIVGLAKHFTAQSRPEIPLLWQRFARWIGKVPHQVDKRTFGVIRNSDKGQGFYYLCGVEVASTEAVPDGLSLVTLPEQFYAIFTHQGPVSALFETMCAIYMEWLPTSNVELFDGPCFELYGEDFDPESGSGLIEVWLPIESIPA